jgi:hypothetical protein
LDYQYTFNFFLNVGQEEKINIFQGWVPVGEGWV